VADKNLDFVFESMERQKQEDKTTQLPSTDSPLISGDQLGNVIDSALNFEEEKQNRAKWSDVIKSGGIRAAAGPVQAIVALAEQAGAVDSGTTANFTNQVLQYEQLGDIGLGQELLRDTLASAIPLTAEIVATRGAPLIPSLKRTSVIGAAGGFTTFVENPEQAAAVSTTRLLNTGLGSILAPMMVAGGIGAGKVISSLTGKLGDIRSANAAIRPSPNVLQQGADTIEQAAKRDIILSPGAATADPALVAQELAAGSGFSDTTKRFLSDVIGSNADSLDGLLDDLIATLIPEGRGAVSESVSTLYEKANKDIIEGSSLQLLQNLRDTPVVSQTVQRILKDPASRSAYTQHPINSIGRLRTVISDLQAQIDSAANNDAKKYLIAIKDKLVNLADDVSPNFSAARSTSQREKTAIEVANALRKSGDSSVVPFKNSASSFASGIQNKEVKEKLMFAIKSLRDPAMRQEALQKYEYLLKVIPKVSELEKTLTSLISRDANAVAARGTVTTSVFYTALNFLNKNNNENFIRFILDPSKSAQRLRETLPSSTTAPEEFLKGFGLWAKENIDGYETSYGEDKVSALSSDAETIRNVSNASKAKTYEKLLRSGELEQIQQNNPDVYDSLFSGYKKLAIV
jgi:hypothetical protein